ncbi:MAG: phage/plasmid primase, P4 family [Candidatus Binatia bacterium]
MGRFDPFANAAPGYYEHGYLPVPLPYVEKHPPPDGTPNSIQITKRKIKEWAEEGPSNVGTVVPEGMVVIDVDGDKPGAWRNFQQLQKRYGKLPRTWRVHRGNPKRFHLWFRVPKGYAWPGKLIDGVDVIYRHYRYVVLPPSVHPSGGLYEWLHADGTTADFGEFPSLNELAQLPKKWIESFANPNGYKVRPRASVDARKWLRKHGAGDVCLEMAKVLKRHQQLLKKAVDPGGMHDAMTDAAWALLRETGAGHTGGRAALRKLRKTWQNCSEASGRRTEDEARREWVRACVGGVEKAAATPVAEDDPCLGAEADDLEDFFGKGGIQIQKLKRAVESLGSLEMSHVGDIMCYKNGVWRPEGDKEIGRRAAQLLGERYRKEYRTTVEDLVRLKDPRFTDSSVDTQYLNLPNGLLDWRIGKLQPHSPEINSVIRIPVKWNPQADCPAIKKWMRQVFPEDSFKFAMEIIGYTLFYGNPFQLAFMLHGKGGNGKGTFLSILEALVGQDNHVSVSPQKVEGRFQELTLYGKLANLAGDVDPKMFKSTEKFKKMTGGDTLTAERKYVQGQHNFRVRATMIASFNKLPQSEDTTEGFFRRWLVLPFSAKFSDEKGNRKKDVINELTTQAELEGLLRYAVRGLRRLMERQKFEIPQSVKKATRHYKMIADPLSSFIMDCTVREQNAFTKRTELYMVYKMWAETNGYGRLSAGRLYEKLESTIPKMKIRGTRGFGGIKLKGTKNG